MCKLSFWSITGIALASALQPPASGAVNEEVKCAEISTRLLAEQNADGTWGSDHSIRSTALVADALLVDAGFVGRANSDTAEGRIHNACAAAFKYISKHQAEAGSADQFARAIFYRSLNYQDRPATESLDLGLENNADPISIRAKFLEQMLAMRLCDYERKPLGIPGPQTASREFEFLDSVAPPEIDKILRLHLKIVVGWVRADKLTARKFLADIFQIDKALPSDELLEAQSCYLLTSNSFRWHWRPHGGPYTSLEESRWESADSAKWPRPFRLYHSAYP